MKPDQHRVGLSWMASIFLMVLLTGCSSVSRAWHQENSKPKHLDVQVPAGPFADYDREFVNSITEKWFNLLDSSISKPDEEKGGQVIVQFLLHSDGSVSEIKIIKSDVSAVLAEKCVQAVRQSAPFDRWSNPMKSFYANRDSLTITFTFYYD